MITTTERGIQQRGASFMVDVCVNGKRHRETVATLDEARALRERLKTALSSSRHASASAWTLGKAFEETHLHIWKGSLSEDASVRNAKCALAFFGENTPLDEITTDWINEWISTMLKGEAGAGTINRKLAALSRMLTFAHEGDHLPKLPMIRRRKEAETIVRFLTKSEETQMLALFDQWAKDDHSEAFCVLVDTGLRPSELWRVEPKHCLWETKVIYIPKTKNHTARSVPMTTRVQEILKRRSEVIPSGPLFPFDNYWFGRVWDRAKTQIGLADDELFVPYALRKTCASRLVQRGVNLKVVQAWLGHKTITVTMRYASQSPENLMDAVKVLEES